MGWRALLLAPTYAARTRSTYGKSSSGDNSYIASPLLARVSPSVFLRRAGGTTASIGRLSSALRGVERGRGQRATHEAKKQALGEQEYHRAYLQDTSSQDAMYTILDRVDIYQVKL